MNKKLAWHEGGFLHTWIDVSMAATSYIGLHWFCRISKQILPSA